VTPSVEAAGIEAPQENAGNTGFSETCRTIQYTIGDSPNEIPPDLGEVINAWPTLSASARSGILAIVRKEGRA
jgi:hypothetical protein